MKFQITENYGQGIKGWSYFTTSGQKTIDELKDIAIKTIKDEWAKINETKFVLHTPTPARPTIKVVEYDNIRNCKIKNGISFKTKWR